VGNELAVPSEDGARRDDGTDAVEHAPGQQAALPRKAPTLVIAEPQPAAAQLLAENLILFHEVVDDGLLAAVDPSGEDQEQGWAERAGRRANLTTSGCNSKIWFWHMTGCTAATESTLGSDRNVYAFMGVQ